ncbi:MFS transporter [Actinokineospora inagensis]|uniref:MFS transporter n=1 Tax=Actinokineospora inagensis TaxID=103730 RepID=UPI000409891B|nr:MFS transporter [Actinokineospora inagensis]
MSTASPPVARPGLTLFAVCAAVLVLPASLTGTSVALPSIGADLHATLAPTQWVVNSYNLTFATFMLATGALADAIGRKRLFGFGVLVFALTSLASVFAGDIYLLDVLRGLSGVGAAAVLTAGSAMIADVHQGPALTRAFGVFGTAAGAGLALGPSTSGLLVGAFGWRAVFGSHLVIMLVVLALVPLLRESRNPGASTVDWLGTVTFTGGLFAFTLAVVEGPLRGWVDVLVLVLLLAAIVLLRVFVGVERRQAQPMFDLSLFRQPRFVALCLLPVVAAFGFVSLAVLLPQYFIGVDGVSSSAAGLRMLLLTLPVLVVPMVGAWLAAKALGTRTVLVLSLLCMAAGTAWLAAVLGPGVGVGDLAVPLLLVGSGMGLNAGIIDGVAISSVEPERAGMAAGMFNTMRLSGEAVAIAVMGALLVTFTQARLRGGPVDATSDLAGQVVQGDVAGAATQVAATDRGGFTAFLADGYTGAFQTALWLIAGICLVGSVVLAVLLPGRQPEPVAPEPVGEPA